MGESRWLLSSNTGRNAVAAPAAVAAERKDGGILSEQRYKVEKKGPAEWAIVNVETNTIKATRETEEEAEKLVHLLDQLDNDEGWNE
jgi:hypothetical protein